MDIGNLIYDGNVSSLSLIGTAKNVGKTVTLQHLLKQRDRFSHQVGVTSIGRDGEEEDVLSGAPKPRIWLQEGMLVASAAKLLVNSQAKLQILENTGVDCALGPIYVAKVTRAGYGELAGPPGEEKLKIVMGLLHDFGATLIFVDGALDRQVSASPAVTQAALLTSGLVLHPDPQTVMRKTAGRVEQLTIPAVPAGLKSSLTHLARDIGAALLREDGEVNFLPISSALGNEAAILKAFIEEPCPRALIILGAVVDSTLEMIMENGEIFRDVPVIIKNGACLFVDEGVWRRFKHSKNAVMALEPIRVAAVTVNPSSPAGRYTPVEPFVRGMSALMPGIPVFDLLAPLGALGGDLV